MRQAISWAAGALLSALLAFPLPAAAVQQIFSCDSTQANNYTTCTGACELATNITCDPDDPNQTGITLTNGADLDMDGLTIACATGKTCGTAVTMAGTNSHVKDTNNSAEARITGNWAIAVDCDGYSGSLVERIHVIQTSSGGVGTDTCRTVRDNVFESSTGTSAIAINEPVTAENNFIKGYDKGVSAVTAASTLDHNLFVTAASGDYAAYAASNSTLASVTGNVVLGPGKPFDTTTSNSVFSENYCDRNDTHCASCISAGRCRGVPTAPFTFP